MKELVTVYQCMTCNKAWDERGKSDAHQSKTKHPKVVILKLPKATWEEYKVTYFMNLEVDN